MVFDSENFRIVIQTKYSGKKKLWLLSAFDLSKTITKKTLGTIKTVLADNFTLGTLLQTTNVYTKMKQKNNTTKKSLQGIENPSVAHLHAYAAMHQRLVNKSYVQRQLASLQADIKAQHIRKTDVHAKAITHIQQQYIKLLNSPNDSFRATIKEVEKYRVNENLGFVPVAVAASYVARKAGKMAIKAAAAYVFKKS